MIPLSLTLIYLDKMPVRSLEFRGMNIDNNAQKMQEQIYTNTTIELEFALLLLRCRTSVCWFNPDVWSCGYETPFVAPTGSSLKIWIPRALKIVSS